MIREYIRAILGTSTEKSATQDADPEDLFGISTANVTMEANLGYQLDSMAGLCFSDVDSSQFQDAIDEVEAILETGNLHSTDAKWRSEDSYGSEWIVVEHSRADELVTQIHYASDTLIVNGFGSRLIAAVFPFEKDGRTVYWIYSFKRGQFYPFAPKSGSRERDKGLEEKMSRLLDGELNVEEDRQYWYPMWPEENSSYPWNGDGFSEK